VPATLWAKNGFAMIEQRGTSAQSIDCATVRNIEQWTKEAAVDWQGLVRIRCNFFSNEVGPKSAALGKLLLRQCQLIVFHNSASNPNPAEHQR